MADDSDGHADHRPTTDRATLDILPIDYCLFKNNPIRFPTIAEQVMSKNDQSPTQLRGAFARSWDALETFYTSFAEIAQWEWLHAMLPIIHDLREHGYDTSVRAGQSMWYCILSRSLNHGLRPDQHYVSLELRPSGQLVVSYYAPDGTDQHIVSMPEYRPVLEHALQRLMQRPLD
jgi:hypothetical protein